MTTLEFAYDDGGRKVAFPNWPYPKGGCVSRAVAIFTGIPYAEVYDAMAEGQIRMSMKYADHMQSSGRRIRRHKSLTSDRPADFGVSRNVWAPYLKQHGCVSVWKAAPGQRGITAQDAFTTYGDCFLKSHGANNNHVVAIKNGKLRDTGVGRAIGHSRPTRYSEVWVSADHVDNREVYPAMHRYIDTSYEDRPVPQNVRVTPTVSNYEVAQRLSQVAELQRQIDALMS